MEAFEFLKEYKRMCDTSDRCEGCPLSEKLCLSASLATVTDDNIKTMVSAVEQWSKDHPVMTNAQKFKEVFGFMPAGCQTFYFVEQNGSYSKTINWQAPYKEPEHEAMR